MKRKPLSRLGSFCLVLAMLLSAPNRASAQEASCDELIRTVGGPCLDAGTGAEKERHGYLPRASRQVLGFTLGRDSFAQAASLWGKATCWESGDGGAGEDKICYVAGRGSGQVTLVLSASVLSDRKIDNLRVIGGRTDFSQKCAALPARLAHGIGTQSGIRLGMTRKGLERILGSATGAHGDLVSYTYMAEKALPKTDPDYLACKVGDKSVASLVSGLTARFEGDRLAWFELGYMNGFMC